MYFFGYKAQETEIVTECVTYICNSNIKEDVSESYLNQTVAVASKKRLPVLEEKVCLKHYIIILEDQKDNFGWETLRV